MQCTQRIGLPFRVAMPPDDDQIGLQCGDALEIERLVVADARYGARGGGIVAVRDGADEPGAAAGGEDQLGRMRREADHPLRRRGERNGVAVVIACAEGGMRRKGDADGEQCRPWHAVPSETQRPSPCSSATHAASASDRRVHSVSLPGKPTRTLDGFAK